MELEFVKLHGLGNDFIVMDDFSLEIELSQEQIVHLCDRHKGVGADGVILVQPSKDPDCLAYMHYINSDGSLAQMCGNGVRCFAKYLVDRGFASFEKASFTALTLAGPRNIRFSLDEFGKMDCATVNMGYPELSPQKIPCTLPANATIDEKPFVKESPLSSPWGEFQFTCVSMGNPHAVCFIDNFDSLADDCFINGESKDLEHLDIAKLGAFFESHPAFPEKTNVEFACVRDTCIAMRVYERGCAETQACGTGACATLVAAALTGRSAKQARVGLLGGVLDISWSEEGSVFMTGKAEESFTGIVRV